MKKRLSVSILLLALATGVACSAPAAKKVAKPAPAKSLPAVMQATGTFDGGELLAKVSIFAAPDESEPASFTIKSPKAFSCVTVKLSGDLNAGKTSIPASRVVLSAVEETKLAPISSFELQPGNAKRFWMRIDVPARTAAGLYKGTLSASANGKVIGKLPVELNVLGIRLLKTSKRNGIMMPQVEAIDETYTQALQSMKDCGFGWATITTPVAQLGDTVGIMKQAGTAGLPIICASSDLTPDTITVACEQAKSVSLRNMLLSAANGPKTPEEIQAACDMSQAIHNVKQKSFAVIDDEAALSQLSGSLDAIDYKLDLSYVQGLMAGAKRTGGKNEWVYWNAVASPKDNRVYSGFLLWKSGLDGMYLPMPSLDSLTGTVQWEALREGIDDTRYLTTLMDLVRQAKDLKKAGDVTDAAEAYVNAVFAKPLTEMSNKDYQGYRLQIAQYIMKLQTVAK
ncbi:MAG: hypothetical protein ABFD64_03140 [Armatimonadota bacterium]